MYATRNNNKQEIMVMIKMSVASMFSIRSDFTYLKIPLTTNNNKN